MHMNEPTMELPQQLNYHTLQQSSLSNYSSSPMGFGLTLSGPGSCVHSKRLSAPPSYRPLGAPDRHRGNSSVSSMVLSLGVLGCQSCGRMGVACGESIVGGKRESNIFRREGPIHESIQAVPDTWGQRDKIYMSPRIRCIDRRLLTWIPVVRYFPEYSSPRHMLLSWPRAVPCSLPRCL